MRFDVVTLFPELFAPHLSHGITRRAFESAQVDVRLWPLRDFADDAYRRVDDRPYGGGPGMVMLAEPLLRALDAIAAERGEAEAGGGALHAHRSPHRPGGGAGVRRRPGCGAAVRALRRHRPAPRRHPCHARAEPGRLRALGGRTAGAGAAGRRGAAAGRRAARRPRTSRTVFPTACSRARSTAGPSGSSSTASSTRCRRCCCRATTASIARWRREQSLALTARRRPDLIAAARAAGRLSRADEACLASLEL